MDFVSQAFTYAPPTPAQLQQFKDLGQWGSGEGLDAKLGQGRLCLQVNAAPAEQGSTTCVRWTSSSVQVLDPVGSEAQRVSGVCLNAAASKADALAQAGGEPLELWLSGFNASIIAHGLTGSGKTALLFGNAQPSGTAPGGLLGWVLQQAFQRLSSSNETWKLGISCYDLHDEPRDLLALATSQGNAPSAKGAPKPQDALVCADVGNFEESGRVLNAARSVSRNWEIRGDAGGGQQAVYALPNGAHAFVRLTLVRGQGQRSTLSTLTFVDLAGSQPLAAQTAAAVAGSKATGAAPGAAASSSDARRRIISQQLASFAKLVTDLGMRQDDTSGEAKPVSIRDSRLSALLAPLLAGNVQATQIATLSAKGQDWQDSAATMRLAMKAATIKTCLLKTRGAAASGLRMVPAPELLQRAAAARQAAAAAAAKPKPRSPTRVSSPQAQQKAAPAGNAGRPQQGGPESPGPTKPQAGRQAGAGQAAAAGGPAGGGPSASPRPSGGGAGSGPNPAASGGRAELRSAALNRLQQRLAGLQDKQAQVQQAQVQQAQVQHAQVQQAQSAPQRRGAAAPAAAPAAGTRQAVGGVRGGGAGSGGQSPSPQPSPTSSTSPTSSGGPSFGGGRRPGPRPGADGAGAGAMPQQGRGQRLREQYEELMGQLEGQGGQHGRYGSPSKIRPAAGAASEAAARPARYADRVAAAIAAPKGGGEGGGLPELAGAGSTGSPPWSAGSSPPLDCGSDMQDEPLLPPLTRRSSSPGRLDAPLVGTVPPGGTDFTSPRSYAERHEQRVALLGTGILSPPSIPHAHKSYTFHADGSPGKTIRPRPGSAGEQRLKAGAAGRPGAGGRPARPQFSLQDEVPNGGGRDGSPPNRASFVALADELASSPLFRREVGAGGSVLPKLRGSQGSDQAESGGDSTGSPPRRSYAAAWRDGGSGGGAGSPGRPVLLARASQPTTALPVLLPQGTGHTRPAPPPARSVDIPAWLDHPLSKGRTRGRRNVTASPKVTHSPKNTSPRSPRDSMASLDQLHNSYSNTGARPPWNFNYKGSGQQSPHKSVGGTSSRPSSRGKLEASFDAQQGGGFDRFDQGQGRLPSGRQAWAGPGSANKAKTGNSSRGRGWNRHARPSKSLLWQPGDEEDEDGGKGADLQGAYDQDDLLGRWPGTTWAAPGVQHRTFEIIPTPGASRDTSQAGAAAVAAGLQLAEGVQEVVGLQQAMMQLSSIEHRVMPAGLQAGRGSDGGGSSRSSTEGLPLVYGDASRARRRRSSNGDRHVSWAGEEEILGTLRSRRVTGSSEDAAGGAGGREEQLQSRVRVLLGVVERETKARAAAEARVKELELEVMETQASGQVVASDLSAEVSRLKLVVQKLQDEQPKELRPLFTLYEQEAQRAERARADLAAANAALSRRLAELELEAGRLRAAAATAQAAAVANGARGSGEAGAGFMAPISVAAVESDAMKELKRQVRRLQERCSGLENETVEARRLARAQALAARQADMRARRVEDAAVRAGEAEDRMVTAGLEAAGARGAAQRLEMEVTRLRSEVEILAQQNRSLMLLRDEQKAKEEARARQERLRRRAGALVGLSDGGGEKYEGAGGSDGEQRQRRGLRTGPGQQQQQQQEGRGSRRAAVHEPLDRLISELQR